MLFRSLGCQDFRVLSSGPVDLVSPEVQRKIGMVGFESITFRAFKLELEDRCEDYGQVAYYQGTIEGYPHSFKLDDHHLFKTGQPMLVCGNTADMVSKTWYKNHFKIVGDKTTHRGLFDCAPAQSSGKDSDCSSGACC